MCSSRKLINLLSDMWNTILGLGIRNITFWMFLIWYGCVWATQSRHHSPTPEADRSPAISLQLPILPVEDHLCHRVQGDVLHLVHVDCHDPCLRGSPKLCHGVWEEHRLEGNRRGQGQQADRGLHNTFPEDSARNAAVWQYNCLKIQLSV